MNPRPFYAVWLGIPGHDEAAHAAFHAACFPPGCDPSGKTAETSAVPAIVTAVSRSVAAEEDKVAVLHAVHADWPNARNLAVMASSTASMPPVGFAPRLAALRESAGHSLADLGDAAGLSRQRVHQLEAGTHRPSWAEVQALASALGVSTEAFRDPE